MYEPGTPAWRPTTEAEILAALEGGNLTEGHHLDLKRELKPGPSGNKELARDIASFAIDGGVLVLGVTEDTEPPSSYPIPLHGLPERVGEVALTRITPPLHVTTLPVTSANDPESGYAVIIVPPSGVAPHMVDGRYYGRSDKTKYVLSDAEVVALHESRAAREHGVLALAEEHHKEAPPHQHGALCLVARPVAAHTPLLESLAARPDWMRATVDLVIAGSASKVLNADIPPRFTSATNVERRPRGVAVTSSLEPGRQLMRVADAATRWNEIELGEDGTLRVLCARATDMPRSRDDILVMDRLIVAYARQTVALVSDIAGQGGYYGPWDLAVVIDGLRGAYSATLFTDFTASPHPYTSDRYTRALRATHEQITAAPDEVARALVLQLLRSLGTASHFFDDAAPASTT